MVDRAELECGAAAWLGSPSRGVEVYSRDGNGTIVDNEGEGVEWMDRLAAVVGLAVVGGLSGSLLVSLSLGSLGHAVAGSLLGGFCCRCTLLTAAAKDWRKTKCGAYWATYKGTIESGGIDVTRPVWVVFGEREQRMGEITNRMECWDGGNWANWGKKTHICAIAKCDQRMINFSPV